VRRQPVSTIFKPDGVICGANAAKRIYTLLNVAIRFIRIYTLFAMRLQSQIHKTSNAHYIGSSASPVHSPASLVYFFLICWITCDTFKGTMAGYHPDINDPDAFVLYRYRPNLAAAVIFIVLFLITTLFHTFQIWRKRTWYFIPLVIGGICTASPYYPYAA
jgi:hypothetical protein